MAKQSMAFLLVTMVLSVQAQQPQGASMGLPYDVSTSCLQSLNLSVACPGALINYAIKGMTVDSAGVSYLCTSSCRSDLVSVRSKITQACTASDTIAYNAVRYPATFFADSLLLAYDIACRLDSTTGQYCEQILANWTTQRFWSNTQICSDCWLGVQALQLGNPLGYDDSLATGFATLTSSCNASQYSYATPTAYALNSRTTAPSSAGSTPTLAPGCTGSYTLQATDTCFSVSQQLNVSTYNMLISNGLDLYCMNFNASVGSNICLPPTCKTHTWQAQDTCESVVLANQPMTLPQFLSWNPNFDPLCQNTVNFIGYQICLSPPGGLLDPRSNSNPSQSHAASAAVPAPTNAMTGSNKKCGAWYTVLQGDTCSLVSVANSISLSDFYFLNPEIDAKCTNLLLGLAYCVVPVGDIRTYSAYPTATGMAAYTVAPNTFAPVNTAIPTQTSAGFKYTYTHLPTAAGTLQNCYRYLDANNRTSTACRDIAAEFSVSAENLVAWNPSLSSNLSNCNLQSGYSYCVLLTNATEQRSSRCTPVNSTAIVPGTSTNCNCFIVLPSYYSDFYGCSNIATDYSITTAQISTWNAWLDSSNCDTSLYKNLTPDNQARPVCVGVNVSQPIGSVSVGTSGTASPTTVTVATGTMTTTMGPTASGEVVGCQQYYTVQSGDTCYNIQTVYSISFAQFYAWNPSIGSDCGSLWLGYAYCVRGPPGSSTANVAASAPTQSGISSNCNRYDTVVNGDSCSAIQSRNNITFDQLYRWNPSIGSNCESLWVGYAVCVGVSS